MNAIRIGVRLESLGLPFRRALQEAARLGVGGVRLDAVGDLAPQNLSQTGRRELRNLLRTYQLELTAVGCPLRHGLGVVENQEARIEQVRKVLTLAFDLGPRRAIVQAGPIPEEPDGPAGRPLNEALLALGHHGDRTGTVLALETGLEAGRVLDAYLSRFDSGGLGVSFDAANLLMNRFDPCESARDLRGRIVHAQAKDARKAGASRAAQEVPLGHGDIDWLGLIGTFEEIDYRGWLTVEAETGENRRTAVEEGVGFLRRLIR